MSNKVMPIMNKNLNFKTITHGFFTREGGFSNKKTLVLIVVLMQMIQF